MKPKILHPVYLAYLLPYCSDFDALFLNIDFLSIDGTLISELHTIMEQNILGSQVERAFWPRELI